MVADLEMWRVAKVSQVTTLSRTTIWRLRRSGEFPQPLDLYGTIVAWESTKVLDWLRSRPSQAVKEAV